MLRAFILALLIFSFNNSSLADKDVRWGPYHCNEIYDKIAVALYAAELADNDQIKALMKSADTSLEPKKLQYRAWFKERKSDYFNHVGEAADWSSLYKNLCK